MTSTSPEIAKVARRDWLAVVIVTVVGGLVRLWALPRSGLTHFDEGIYALAGGWVFQKAGIDAALIPYAPPLYAILVGAAYLVVGVSDLAAMLVSVVVGTLTIPLMGLVGRRLVGVGGGAAVATILAFAGPHIVFSRMALTDATFLAAWLVALLAGDSFIRRPTLVGGILMGLSVGVAQLSKYNGWLSGAIVAASALLDPILIRDRRSRSHLLRVFGFGAFGAVVAAAIYAPWFLFVERHGGYPDLLRHQRSYLGGLADWPGHLLAQWRQESALSGTSLGPIAAVFVACWVCAVPTGRDLWKAVMIAMAWMMNPNLSWVFMLWGGARFLGSAAPKSRFWALAWLIPAILTPFYHPYARLWLPVSTIGSAFLATFLVAVVASPPESAPASRGLSLLAWAALAIAMALRYTGVTGVTSSFDRSTPTDSLRLAIRRLTDSIPREVRSIQVLARPPATFYLAGRIGTRRLPDLGSLAPGEWAVIDEVQALQEVEGRTKLEAILARAKIVGVEENELGSATRLDVDPASATRPTPFPPAKLWLIRP